MSACATAADCVGPCARRGSRLVCVDKACACTLPPSAVRAVVAALVVEAAMLVILKAGNVPGPAQLRWYRELRTSAFAMDVLSVSVCVLAARQRASLSLASTLAWAVAIQMGHDLAFGALLAATPRGTLRVFDLFQDYARPAILGYDALIVASAVLVERLALPPLAGMVAAYVALLLVHSM